MSFATPAWLILLLLIPALLVAALLVSRGRQQAWRSLVAGRLRQSLIRAGSPLPRWLALAALLAAFACLVIALARPQGNADTRTEAVRGRNVLIALDLSRSMLVSDVSPNRLDQARTIALELVDSLPNDRIGVIAFAGTSYLLAPLTVDHPAVSETIQQLDTNTIPTGGSNLAGAVELATEVIRDNDIRKGALILVSDGEEHDGDIAAAAMDADRAGLFIFSVAVGTDDGGFVPDPRQADGRYRDRSHNTVLSRLQDTALRKLASETGGRYVRASSGTAIGPMVDAAISDLERIEIDLRKRVISVEFFQWLMLPAVLLLMAAILAGTNWRPLRSKSPAATLVATALLTTPPPVGAAVPEAEIQRFSELAEASRGREQFRYRLAQGTTALSGGDLRVARSALSNALLTGEAEVQAAAHHNLGNALVESGWQLLSGGEPYPGNEEAPGQLDAHVARHLEDWMGESDADAGSSEGLQRFESILLAWTDAVRHFDSAVAADPRRDDSQHNTTLSRNLLDSLRKTMEQALETAEQALPSPQPEPQEQGQPEPQPGDQDDEQEPQNGGGDEKQQDSPPEDDGDQQDENESGDEQESDDADQGRESKDKQDHPPREDETPEERARRLLNENADFETRPPIRGTRRQLRNPAKDW